MNRRFLFVLGAFVVLVFLTYRDSVLGQILGPLNTLTADVTFWSLKLLNMEVIKELTVIRHSQGFAYEIYFRCTGVLPITSLSVFILAYSAHWRQKMTGLAVGIPLFLMINQLRLIHLFTVGVYYPQYFDLVHNMIWEIIIILITLVIWLGWVRWVTKINSETSVNSVDTNISGQIVRREMS